MDAKEIIARRAAKEIQDGDVVNLGIGMPTLIADYISPDIDIVLQSENGILGMGKLAEEHQKDKNIVNAGATHVTVNKGAVFFDTATSFGIIRGGHVDVTFLGALQVDEQGSLASHIIPNKLVPGMGGAMDLVAGAKKVIVVTTHTAKDSPKILKQCTLPLTAYKKVKMIITELAVIECTSEGLLLKEINKDTTIEEVVAKTDAHLIIPNTVATF
ncbi:MAG: 3-oxoacid CoA-transferase subunit B [Clostridia bacterium]|nr:3-oxoacid CoA-transferase subunit B [Clostridia bacterium]